MKSEFYYKEEYPKELRITIENELEFQLLRLIFTQLTSDSLQNIVDFISDAGIFSSTYRLCGMSRSQQQQFIEDICAEFEDKEEPLNSIADSLDEEFLRERSKEKEE